MRVLYFVAILLYCATLNAGLDEFGNVADRLASEKNKKSVVVSPAPPETLKEKVSSWWEKAKKKVASFKKPQEKPDEIAQEEKIQPEKKVAEQMPVFITKGVDNTTAKVESLNKNMTKKAAVQSTPGRKADKSLYKTKSGVAQIPLFDRKKIVGSDGKAKVKKIKIKNIEYKDVGEEPRISANEFALGDLALLRTNYKQPEPFPGPSNKYTEQKNKWFSFIPTEDFAIKGTQRKDYGLGQIVTQESIDKTDPEIKSDMEMAELVYLPFNEDEITMLGALIIYAKGNKCHLVAGLFSELTKNKKLKDEANFYLGICAHQMGFYAESVYRLLEVIAKEDSYYTTPAVKAIVSHLPLEYEVRVAKALLNVKNKELLPKDAMDDVNYILAKGSVKKRQYKKALSYAVQVSDKSKKYAKALFIESVSLYSTHKIGKAIEKLKMAKKWMRKKGINDEETFSLISVNLARMYFQNNQFSLSNDEYLRVDKDSSYWVQALVEQGWAQLLMNDPSGAIGNMYSLHSPYFKSVYKPESFAVRTIGYLDICQYGDAYQTLKLMEDRYRPWIKRVGGYMKKNKKPSQYYKTIKTYLKGKSTVDVHGVPYPLLREIARKRNFLNYQDSINQKIDEVAQYDFIDSMIRKDKSRLKWRRKKSVKRQKQAKVNIRKSKKNKALKPKVNEWKAKTRFEKKFIASMNFQLDLLEKSRLGFKKLKKSAVKRIDREKRELKGKAGKELKSNMKFVKSQMEKVLENNELLRFEVFSGSGENIRYQVAGGKVKGDNRLPANYKPSKTLNWSVIGEYWQDEIGSYRSQLKNNCPKKARLPGQRANRN